MLLLANLSRNGISRNRLYNGLQHVTSQSVIMSLYDTQRVILRELLVRQRKVNQLTQTQLAEKLSRPQSFVSKYESGERKLDIVELIDVLHSLNCSPTEFIEEYCNKIGE